MQADLYKKDLWAIGAYVTPAASLAALEIMGSLKEWANSAYLMPGMPYASQVGDLLQECRTSSGAPR
jgi:predicted permease